ncbi:hypothetical protein I552_7149 [Mycobacterium xenopi 3993]|nr:hypothetical protein I552_7149 [Mycobacterium xenopi 3993]
MLLPRSLRLLSDQKSNSWCGQARRRNSTRTPVRSTTLHSHTRKPVLRSRRNVVTPSLHLSDAAVAAVFRPCGCADRSPATSSPPSPRSASRR